MRKPTTDKKTPRGDHAVLLRLPVPLHRQLRSKADEEQRSVSGHIRYLIEQDLAA